MQKNALKSTNFKAFFIRNHRLIIATFYCHLLTPAFMLGTKKTAEFGFSHGLSNIKGRRFMAKA
jgi:hypothetical protein